MDEDARYRSSTQYRFWSFTRSSLVNLREETNRVAAEKVRDAIRRARATAKGTESDEIIPEDIDVSDVECLTVEEEARLLNFYCRQLIQMGDHLMMPTDVKATALQYLQRFYLHTSLMTYPATTLLKTSLYLATKTENHYLSLSKFAAQVSGTSADDIRASEFLLTQGLRFTFDVRHPFRALEGAVMDMSSISHGGEDLAGRTIVLPTELLRPYGAPADVGSDAKNGYLNRVKLAHGRARETLKTSASLSDAYFLYTPSQIMFAALLMADPELTTFYLGTKFPNKNTDETETVDIAAREKVLLVLKQCAETVEAAAKAPKDGELKELTKLAKKLKRCQNPEKQDFVALSKATKRGEGGDEAADARAAKKRKMERERMEEEGNELFGGALKKS